MKTYKAKRGPFNERPYYELKDVETICLDELRAVGLYPKTPSPIRIERFLEKRFEVTPHYDDLPDGVLGFTVFGADGVEEIVIARSLDEDGSQQAERRIRTTMGHEGGHGLLHAHLFVLNRAPLFGLSNESGKPKVLCRDEFKAASPNGSIRYDGRWWEYQANMAMSALLLPRPLVEIVVESFMIKTGFLRRLDEKYREEAVQKLAGVFEVNPVVARIRVNDMYLVTDSLQLSF